MKLQDIPSPKDFVMGVFGWESPKYSRLRLRFDPEQQKIMAETHEEPPPHPPYRAAIITALTLLFLLGFTGLITAGYILVSRTQTRIAALQSENIRLLEHSNTQGQTLLRENQIQTEMLFTDSHSRVEQALRALQRENEVIMAQHRDLLTSFQNELDNNRLHVARLIDQNKELLELLTSDALNEVELSPETKQLFTRVRTELSRTGSELENLQFRNVELIRRQEHARRTHEEKQNQIQVVFDRNALSSLQNEEQPQEQETTPISPIQTAPAPLQPEPIKTEVAPASIDYKTSSLPKPRRIPRLDSLPKTQSSNTIKPTHTEISVAPLNTAKALPTLPKDQPLPSLSQHKSSKQIAQDIVSSLISPEPVARKNEIKIVEERKLLKPGATAQTNSFVITPKTNYITPILDVDEAESGNDTAEQTPRIRFR